MTHYNFLKLSSGYKIFNCSPLQIRIPDTKHEIEKISLTI